MTVRELREVLSAAPDEAHVTFVHSLHANEQHAIDGHCTRGALVRLGVWGEDQVMSVQQSENRDNDVVLLSDGPPMFRRSPSLVYLTREVR